MNISRCELCGAIGGDCNAEFCVPCTDAILRHKTAVKCAAGITAPVVPGPTLSTCCGKHESVKPIGGLGGDIMVVECNHCHARTRMRV